MENKPLINRYLLTPEIMADFYKKNLFLSPFFLAVEGFLLLSLGAYLLHMLRHPTESWKNLILCALYTLGVFLLRIFQYFGILKKYREANKEPSFVSYTLRENGIRAKNERTEAAAFYAYGNISRCRMTKKLLILDTTDRNCILLSKDAFPEEEKEAFLSVLAEKLPQFAKKISRF